MLTLCLSCVDPGETAVARLIEHFNNVMEGILIGSWRHFTLERNPHGAGRYSYDRKQLENKLVFDLKPSCFLLQPHCLRRRLIEGREKAVTAFRRFDFGLYTPVLSTVFGAEVVVDQGSGIEELFPGKPVGRPRKQRLEAKRSGEQSGQVADILFQATDGQTKTPFVLVRWQGEALTKAEWVPLSGLSPATADWWQAEAELRFPFLDFANQPPLLRLTGGPPVSVILMTVPNREVRNSCCFSIRCFRLCFGSFSFFLFFFILFSYFSYT